MQVKRKTIEPPKRAWNNAYDDEASIGSQRFFAQQG
jgi:hypothetical protein